MTNGLRFGETGDALNILIGELVSEDRDKRYDAAFRLHKLGRGALRAALELARDPRPRMREMACFVLGRILKAEGPKQSIAFPVYYDEGVPVLTELLRGDSDVAVRASAAAALGWQNKPDSIPVLIRCTSDASKVVRLAAVQALGSYLEGFWENQENARYRPQSIAALLARTDDEEPEIRDWAIFGLRQGAHDTPEVRNKMRTAIHDTNPDIRGEAMVALARFHDPSVRPEVVKALRSADPSLYAFEAAEALSDKSLSSIVRGAERRWKAKHPGKEIPWAIASAAECLKRNDPIQDTPTA